MALSLFGRNQHRRHVVSAADVAEEFFNLLSAAREDYQYEVVVSGKQYNRYVDDFVNSHRFVACRKTVCRNCHEMNIHIVSVILTDYAAQARQVFDSGQLTEEKALLLKKMYDSCEPVSLPEDLPGKQARNPEPLSFCCTFSKEQLTAIAECAETYGLFFHSPVTCEDMESLFSCKEGFCLRVNNIRNIAILFDTLLENRLISKNWQHVLSARHLLLSKNGKRYVSSSSISSGLSAERKNMTSSACAIQKMISRIMK